MDTEEFSAAVKMAIEREEEAIAFYQKLAASSKDDSLKKFFEHLASQESVHKWKLEDRFRRLII